MSRRAVNITLDNLDDLPGRCRSCVFWELDPVAHDRAAEAGDTAFEKESWVSATLLDWGSCGKVVYVDGVPAGFVMYAPPAYVPRSVAFPTSPVSADAVLLMTGHVHPDFAGGGLGRMLVQGVTPFTARTFRDPAAVAAARRPHLVGQRHPRDRDVDRRAGDEPHELDPADRGRAGAARRSPAPRGRSVGAGRRVPAPGAGVSTRRAA